MSDIEEEESNYNEGYHDGWKAGYESALMLVNVVPTAIKRKVAQLLVVKRAVNSRLVALCDDGTMWAGNEGSTGWSPIKDIPQEETPNE